MSKAPSPLLGFNNNIRHKGRVFHVQTEDSGIRHPHVITHLFMDGGRILKTTKTSYAEHIGKEGMGEIVRKLMKEQHKSMFVALRNGDFDELIGKHFGGGEDVPAVPEPLPSIPSIPAAQESAPLLPPPASPPPAPPSSAPPVRPSTAPATPSALRPPPVPPSARPPARAPSVRPPPITPPPSAEAPDTRVSSHPPLARSVSPASGMRVPFTSELPPPPANVLQTSRPEGGYREVRSESESSSTYSEVRPTDSRSSSRLPAARPRPTSGRHLSARPQTGQQRPPEGGSIFGDDVNEKSLDEVILSYLAEDLDSPGGKKK